MYKVDTIAQCGSSQEDTHQCCGGALLLLHLAPQAVWEGVAEAALLHLGGYTTEDK